MNLIIRYTLLATLLYSSSWAQENEERPDSEKPWKINVGIGTANYYGDFVNPGSMGTLGPSINVEGEYAFSPRWSVRSSLGWFQLEGSDINANDSRWQRNLNFKSNVFEWTMTAHALMYERYNGANRERTIYPYAFLGIGLMTNNPKTEYQGEKVALRPLRTENETYGGIQLVVPGGIGFRFMVSQSVNFLFEGGYRWTFTDYLDDVSKFRYVDQSLLSSDLSRALSDRRPEIGTQPANPTEKGLRGNPNRNDGYLLLNLKLQIYMPKKEKEEKAKPIPTQDPANGTARRSIFNRR